MKDAGLCLRRDNLAMLRFVGLQWHPNMCLENAMYDRKCHLYS